MNKLKKIGIWGFGKVGKSIASFLKQNCYNNIEVYDNRRLNKEEKEILKCVNITQKHNLEEFLNQNNYIIPSPGINLNKLNPEYKNKLISEVDLFFIHWKKPVIAVTGSIGKTTVVTILTQLLQINGIKAISGGNSGIPLLTLLENQNDSDTAIIELSSFQLEHSNYCKPEIAIWTNFFKNHLDRHLTIENYFQAKINLIKKEVPNQKIIIPLQLRNQITNQYPEWEKKEFTYFSFGKISKKEINLLSENDTLYFFKKNKIIKYRNKKEKTIALIKDLPTISYKQNWLIISSLCDILNIKINSVKNLNNLFLPHRLEYLGNYKNIHFYNDSKSTLPEATYYAVQEIFEKHNFPINLFMCGLSKGINRGWLFEKIKNKINSFYCFGNESEQLNNFAKKWIKNSYKFKTLNQAIKTYIQNSKPNDVLLFSPGGSSFDQFKNFEARGNYFKKMVKELFDS